MNAIVTFPNFEKYGGAKRSRMTKAGTVSFPVTRKGYSPLLALFYDAERAAFKELTRNKGHDFNSMILGPQYQRNADGSYTNVGANPAVDVFNGEKWLRSCGAVDQKADSPIGQGAVVATNTLPTGWRKLDAGAAWSVVGVGDGYVDVRFSGTVSAINALYFMSAATPASVGQTWSTSLSIEILSGSANGVLLNIRERTGTAASQLQVSSGELFLTRTLTDAGTTGVEVFLSVSLLETYNVTFRIRGVNFYQSAYPLPFVPVKATMPASNATTTNGVWFSNPQYTDAETADGQWKRDGVELVVNGGFDSDTWWGKDPGVSIVDGKGVFTAVATGTGFYKTGVLTVGERYRVSYDIVSISSGALRAPYSGTLRTAPGRYTEDIVATSTSPSITANTSTTNAVVDNLSVQRLIPAARTAPLWKALDGDVDGVELVTNGGFDSWSGDNPVGWSVGAETATEYVTQSSGAARIVTTTGSGIYFEQTNKLVVGQRYVLDFDIVTHPVGTLVFYTLGVTLGIWAVGVVGKQRLIFTATGHTFGFKRSSTLDVTIDNISIQRIKPSPMTLATRVMMGVGSGDLPATVGLSIIRSAATTTHEQYTERNSSVGKTTSTDGTSYPSLSHEWSRNSIIRRVTQVNTAGTQFRVGYMIEGVHITVQWSAWANFDGSFNPSTIYRLMLGYNNAYPMWFNKIAVWGKECTDAEILEALK